MIDQSEKIDVSFEAGKVVVDIDLSSGTWAFDLTVGESVVLIEKLTHAVLHASMAASHRG